MSTSSLYQHTLQNFRRVAEMCQIHPDLVERLAHPKERIELTLNTLLTDGRVHQFQAYIVHHNRSLGPAKGGIRMSDTVTLDDVSALAMEMTWKTSLIGVPFGGGKSGIAVDPRSLSAQDKEILIRSFTRSAIRHIGPEVYVPAPDMGTNERDMGHIRDCISYSAGISVPRGCYVTGKPVLVGGIPGRREATGKGVAVTVRLAARRLDMDLARTRVAVQGFGNVGSVAAAELHGMGAKVVAVADIQGVTCNPSGLDIQGLHEHVRGGGEVPAFSGGNPYLLQTSSPWTATFSFPPRRRTRSPWTTRSRSRHGSSPRAPMGPPHPRRMRSFRGRGCLSFPISFAMRVGCLCLTWNTHRKPNASR